MSRTKEKLIVALLFVWVASMALLGNAHGAGLSASNIAQEVITNDITPLDNIWSGTNTYNRPVSLSSSTLAYDLSVSSLAASTATVWLVNAQSVVVGTASANHFDADTLFAPIGVLTSLSAGSLGVSGNSTFDTASFNTLTSSSGTVKDFSVESMAGRLPLLVYGNNTFGAGAVFKGNTGTSGAFGVAIANISGPSGVLLSNNNFGNNSSLYRQDTASNPSGFVNDAGTAGFEVDETGDANFYGNNASVSAVVGNAVMSSPAGIELNSVSLSRSGGAMLAFGGFYSQETIGGACRLNNPATGACSCSFGFSAQYLYDAQIGNANCAGAGSVCFVYLCWRL